MLTLDETDLVYTPIPGETLTVPMDGNEVEVREGEHRIRTTIEWNGPLLSLEHQVVSGGRVRETLEVIGDRLIMTARSRRAVPASRWSWHTIATEAADRRRGDLRGRGRGAL